MNQTIKTLCLICVITLLPFSNIHISFAEEATVGQSAVIQSTQTVSWDNSMFSEDVVLEGSAITKGTVTMLNGSELILNGGQFVVTPGTVFNGNIVLQGNGSRLSVSGTVNGCIRVTAVTGSITISGKVDGTLSIENIEHLDEEEAYVQAEIVNSGSVTLLQLAGVGQVYLYGKVDTIDTSVDNDVKLRAEEATIGTLYARSDVCYELFDETNVDEIYVDGLGGTYGDDCVVDVSLFYESTAGKVIVNAGFIDIFDGSTVKNLYMYGSSIAHIDEGVLQANGTVDTSSRKEASVNTLILKGANTLVYSRGHIGYCYVEGGRINNAGQIDTLVANDAYLDISRYEIYGDDDGYIDIFDSLFSCNVKILIAIKSTLIFEQEASIETIFIEGSNLSTCNNIIDFGIVDSTQYNTYGSIDSNTEIKTLVGIGTSLPRIRTENITKGINHKTEFGDYQPQTLSGSGYQSITAGSKESKAKTIKPGSYKIEATEGSQWLSLEADAYTALNFTFVAYGGYGYALVQTPDGLYEFLDLSDGEQSLSLMSEESGTYLIRLIGAYTTDSFTVTAEADYPVRIDYMLSETAAAEKGQKAKTTAGDPDDYTITLYDQTTQSALTEFKQNDTMLYGMPSLTNPDDTITATLYKDDGSIPEYSVTFMLDNQRHVQVAFEGVALGWYQSEVADTGSLHLYLYDKSGAYLDEIYDQGGVYTIDSLSPGTYDAVYIRASVGGWKLLDEAEFAQNGLEEGVHYLVDRFTIESGVIVSRDDLDVPDEPGIQSEWLDASGTSYQTSVGSAVKDSLVLMTLDWTFAQEEIQNASVSIQFQTGADYVDGSACVGNNTVPCTWKGKTLTVPLDQSQGRLLFYMEGDGTSDALISNAFVTFSAQGQIYTQYIGSAQTQIVPLSINGPTLTADRVIRVYGYSQPYSIVSLYDNQTLVSSALADGNGFWTEQITLSQQKEHFVTVGTQDGDAVSEPITVTVAGGAPKLEQFALYYTEHIVSKQIVIDGDAFGTGTVRFAYEPGTDLTFVLDVENDQYVESVTVVGVMNGHRESIEAQRDPDSGEWTAVGCFTSDQMFAPDTFAIEYTFNEEDLALAYQEPYIGVPLMDTLYSVADFDDDISFTRYYMASPTLQQIDTGFGPGWFTQYSMIASPFTEDDRTGLLVWSPTKTRVFYKDGSKYYEENGYATAKIDSEDIITVSEANGGSLTFSADGRLTRIKDGYGTRTTLTYNDDNLLTTVKKGEQKLIIEYLDGTAVSITLGNEQAAYQYTLGYLTNVSGSKGFASYSYDGLTAGTDGTHPLVSANDWADTARFRYNEEGYPVRIEQSGVTQALTYGEHTVSIEQDGLTTTYTLDNDQQVTAVDTSDGSWEEIIRSDENIILRITSAAGAQSEIICSLNGEPLRITDANGNTTSLQYDENGWLTGITDANGNTTGYAYDEAGSLKRITYPDETKESFAYNESGQLLSYTDRSKQKTTYLYNNDGSLKRITYADETKTSYQYDDYGNLCSAKSSEMDSYNNIDENSSRYYSTGDENGLYLEINKYGVLIYVSYNDYGISSNYSTDQNLTSVSNNEGTVDTLEHTAENLVSRETRANDTYTTYEYDELNRLTRMKNCAADGSVLSWFAMTYDLSGNITQYDTLEGTWLYAYDAAGQLVKTTDPSGYVTEYAYDPAGNRVSKSVNEQVTEYEVNALNQYTRIGDTTYEYDANGLLIKACTADSETRYAWNAQQQLVSVETDGQITKYGYDVYGNRNSVTVNGVTTRYAAVDSDLPFIIASMVDGQETTYYDYSANGLIASHQGNVTLYYSYNPLGSVTDITDESGNLVRHYVYDAEGNVTAETVPDTDTVAALAEATLAGLTSDSQTYDADALAALTAEATQTVEAAVLAAESNPFTYVGRYGIIDDGDGLWYMRARYVDQATSRFIAPDPAGQAYDLNLYRYALNNLIMFTDLSGKDSIPPINNTYSAANNYRGSGVSESTFRAMETSAGEAQAAESIWTRLGKTTTAKIITKSGGWLAGIGFVVLTDAQLQALGYYTGPTGIAAPIQTDLIMGQSSSDVSIDPSGYVYEAVKSNRVEGVTATVYIREDGKAVTWGAAEYDQTNPQTTDELGEYAWYVPTGEWKVIFEKDGYETLETKWLPVPPPKTEVNVGIISYAPPEISHATLYEDAVDVTFSKYMDIDSMLAALSLTDETGADIAITVTPLNAEVFALDETIQLASRFSLTTGETLPEQAIISISTEAISYSGTAAQAQSVSLNRTWRLETLGLEAEYSLAANSTQTIILQATGEGHYDTLHLSAETDDMADVTIDSVSALDPQGHATITLTTQGAGKATLYVSELNTGYTAAVLLSITPGEEE